jgi:arylsulfatase
MGYRCGQFGKNHLGDRDEFLPTAHGFDEFFGNLYHLNAEEEPELPDYPKDPEFRKMFGPRGVLHTWAQPDGSQNIEDTGPLTKKRMQTIDSEINESATRFIRESVEEDQPFFVWWNATYMHFRTHVRPEDEGRTGQGFYADAMAFHDENVGEMLDLLDELGIADNTIVMYSIDNGPHYNAWPDAGITPFRSEKNTNWEGAFRVPTFFRWPGHFPAGSMLNGIVSHQDVLPTLLAAVGADDVKEKLLSGYQAGNKTFKVHLDGHNMLDYFCGKTSESPRREFFYVNDDAQLVALRYDDWKLVFQEQRAEQMMIWAEPFVELRVPMIFNLRRDPFERAQHGSNTYFDWLLDHVFLLVPAQSFVAKMLKTLVDYPPRQTPDSFNMDKVLAKMQEASGAGLH